MRLTVWPYPQELLDELVLLAPCTGEWTDQPIDLACGPGLSGLRIHNRFDTVLAVDPSPT